MGMVRGHILIILKASP